MEKRFKLAAVDIQSLARGRGYCFASDLITVDGKRVGYMYREAPGRESDSGWRFFAGTESPEYTAEQSNFAIYDVNTIANYDPEIVPFLDEPPCAAFERDSDTGRFRKVEPQALQ